MRLCNNNFLDFFETLPDNITSIEELLQYIEKCISSIADVINLGRFDAKFNTPKEIKNSLTKNGFFILYQDNSGYNDIEFSNTFRTYSGGNVCFNAYPKTGCEWSDDDVSDIHFLSHIINLIFDKNELLRQMHDYNSTDSTTGVNNNVALKAYLVNLCQNNQQSKYTALFFNIKNFRHINQTFGASNANVILRQYAQRMNSYVLSDEIFCRLGGDNFVAVIGNSRIEHFLELTSCVRLHINLKEVINTFDISSRIGIYSISETDAPETIITNITLALNISKTSNNQDLLFFDPAMVENVKHDKELIRSFPQALNLNEFFVCYQPIVHMADNKVCAYEALVRWNKNGKILYPNEFIPIFERESTICLLDFYVLEKVCEYTRQRLDSGKTAVRTFVNFSKIHLHNKCIADDIISIIENYNIDPKYIGIELTENCCYENYEALASFLKSMKEYGIYTAIDDFGTGYSSLNMLSTLNANIIKLDNSFINETSGVVSSENQKKALVRAIINLAKELNMEVTCEGVEAEEQSNFLKSLDCPMAQGFFFDKP